MQRVRSFFFSDFVVHGGQGLRLAPSSKTATGRHQRPTPISHKREQPEATRTWPGVRRRFQGLRRHRPGLTAMARPSWSCTQSGACITCACDAVGWAVKTVVMEHHWFDHRMCVDGEFLHHLTAMGIALLLWSGPMRVYDFHSPW